jgi:hypothetical protein
MLETAIKNLSRVTFFVVYTLFLLLGIATIVIAASSVDTTFTHIIGDGNLSVDIVDGDGESVVSPGVTFASEIYYDFAPQDTTGTLGTSSEKIRVTNARSVTDTWTVSIAAKLGPDTTWTTGTYTHPFDSTGGADSGRLTVNPSGGTITPGSGCSSDNLSKGSSDYFVSGTTDSIDLLSAGSGADVLCYWDFTGVSLTQRIPGGQEPGTYTLAMTISVI